MNGDFMNVLITGATSGIGRDLALTLAQMGHHVFACCHTIEELERLRQKRLDNVEYLKLDITREEDYQILSHLSIDVLVNQAGIGVGGSILDLEVSELERSFEVNVFSTLKISKFYIEDCYKKKRKGKILITSSLAGYLPIPFMGSYVATKASLIILTKVLKKEIALAGLDIQIKLILPGAYRTGFNQHMVDFIGESKYFRDSEKNWQKMRVLFDFVEKRRNRTIVYKMVKAVVTDSSKLTYSAPFGQSMMVKLYRMFFY